MTTNVSPSDSRLDSRDILSYVADLIEEVEELRDLGEDGTAGHDDRQDEIDMWQAFLTEAEDHAGDNADDGIFFVARRAWVEYAEEFATDVCEMPEVARWPFNCIDWKEAAEELEIDYTEITVNGFEFLYR